jgi:Mn-dependent DtxR family transcriptional regulator
MMFYKLGWPKELSVAESYMYASVIPMLEEEKDIIPGGWVFTTYEEISRYLGKSKPYVTKLLKFLTKRKLIEWKRGKRGKDHSATKIRRIVPIPHPQDGSP